ncbi:stearoyl-CoA desaturase 4 [Folsomia candida]|uniref:stearoyl-CoA desaturase 4 n=1 Tax=Folsomia candida TaxID=158441 RepID=UPI000B8FE46A|nr:stearoyl-CoA desaturase 4 [Folsomia candida]
MEDRKSISVTAAPKRSYHCTSSHPFGLEMHQWNRIWVPPIHALGLYGIYLILWGRVPWGVVYPTIVMGYFMGVGITVGCHRYWSHRTFKAKLPLQIFLAVAQTAAGQHSIFKWSKDHRLHHKYTETAADPYNSRRGFWFAHMGWLLVREDPAVREKEHCLDFSDLDNDPIVRFQSRHYRVLEFLAVFAVPIWTLMSLFPTMSLLDALAVNSFRYMTTLHFTWLVNSAAHLYGYKKYDTRIFARENKLVALLAIGEGWHNYHHVYPQDYKAAELGAYGLNWSCAFIDLCAYFGLAYDLKTVPHEVVMARVRRTGDDAGGMTMTKVVAGVGRGVGGTSTSRRNTTTSRRP